MVNDLDVSLLAAHWQQQSDVRWGDGDFNYDDIVNDLDVSLLANHWQAGVEQTRPVPEPLSGALLGAGAVALLLWTPRRKQAAVHGP